MKLCQKCYKSRDTFQCPDCNKWICFKCLQDKNDRCPLCNADLKKWDHEFGYLP